MMKLKLKQKLLFTKCSALEVICCLFRREFFIQSSIIKKNCKTAFSIKFKTMKLKTEAQGIVGSGVSTLLKNTTSLFFAKLPPPLNLLCPSLLPFQVTPPQEAQFSPPAEKGVHYVECFSDIYFNQSEVSFMQRPIHRPAL